jgi:uncharacterized protein (DUF488 family)
MAGVRGVRLLTVGHGPAPAADFDALLAAAGVRGLVDVRIAPGSRRAPWFSRDELSERMARAGVEYRWERDLGGRRRPRPGSRHRALPDDGFRGYADHMEGTSFRAALDGLLEECAVRPTACLCAEADWRRCHRRLIADAAALTRGATVQHLTHDGTVEPHVPTAGVRVDGGRLVYDAGQAPLPGMSG